MVFFFSGLDATELGADSDGAGIDSKLSSSAESPFHFVGNKNSGRWWRRLTLARLFKVEFHSFDNDTISYCNIFKTQLNPLSLNYLLILISLFCSGLHSAAI